MPDLVQSAPAGVPASAPAQRYFQRFTREQRYMHAVLFTTFLGLAATGLPMRFSESFWARRVAAGVGGFGAILFFHKFFAVVLTIAFLIHVREVFVRGVLNREKGIFWGPTSMVANWKDVKDLFGHMRWFLGLGPKPQFERYAYWEKFDYWAVFWGIFIIGGSGALLWGKVAVAKFLPGWVFNVALIFHGEEAVLAAVFLFTVHFFNNHFRPDKFPLDTVMFTGAMSLEEFKREHAVEYNRLVETGRLESHRVPAPSPAMALGSRILGFTLLTIGLLLLLLVAIGFVGHAG